MINTMLINVANNFAGLASMTKRIPTKTQSMLHTFTFLRFLYKSLNKSSSLVISSIITWNDNKFRYKKGKQ